MLSSSVELVGIPASDIPDIWPTAVKLLDKPISLSGGRLSRASVLEALLHRDMQLWLAVDKRVLAAMVTQISIYPTGLKVLMVILIGGGKMDSWFHLWPRIEDWGRSQGCKMAEVPRGRKGWKRVLDWNEMVFMEKEL